MGWVVNATLRSLYPPTPGKTPIPIYKRQGSPQGRAGWVRKISLPPGTDPRTVQSVETRYTNRAILAHKRLYIK